MGRLTLDDYEQKEPNFNFKRNGLINGLVIGAYRIIVPKKEEDGSAEKTSWDHLKENGLVNGSVIIGRRALKDSTKKISAAWKEFYANEKAMQQARETADENIKKAASEKTKIKDASKNGDFVSAAAEEGSKFLNAVDNTIAAAVSQADKSELKEVNSNLKSIKSAITNFTKAAIDKQDTSIKKTSKAAKTDIPKSSEAKIKNTKEEKKGGLWDLIGDWLKSNLLRFLLGLAAFAGLVKLWDTLGKWLGLDGRVWDKLGAFLAFITANDGFLRRIVTEPVKWFMDDVLPFAKGKILEWVDLGLEKVKGWVSDKIKSVSNIIKESAVGKAVGSAIDAVADTAKSVGSKVGGFFGGLWDKGMKIIDKGTDAIKATASTAKSGIMGKLGSLFDSVAGKIKNWCPAVGEFYEKFVNAVKKSIPVIKRVGKRLLWICKAVLKFGAEGTAKLVVGASKKMFAKVAAKAAQWAAFALSVVTGPLALIVQAGFMIWTAWDIYKYLANMHPEENLEYKIIPALVYAFIGWDLLDKDTKDVWNNIPEMDESEKDKISNSLTSEEIKKASFEEASQMSEQLKAEQSGYHDQVSRLSNNIIKYQDANGNLLSDEDSAKIQSLQLEQYVLREEKSKLLQEKINRKDPNKFFEGEVEISAEPEKFQKLADYWFDKIKLSNSTCRMYSGDFDMAGLGSVNTANIEKDRQTHLVAMSRLLKEGDIVGAAREKGWADYYEKGIQMAKSGQFKNWNSITKELEKYEAYETINEKLVKINHRINDTQRNINLFGSVSEASSSSGSFSGASAITGDVPSSAGADISSASSASSASTFSDVQSSVASGSSTPRAVAAANYAWQMAGAKSTGRCAKFVNDAIINAGYSGYGKGHGYQVGQSLMNIGWRPLSPGEPLKVGDVACIDKFSGHPYGHAAILSSNGWVSDFRQKASHPGGIYKDPTAQRLAMAGTAIYRDPGNTSLNVRTSLRNVVLKGPSANVSGSAGADPSGVGSNGGTALPPVIVANNVTKNTNIAPIESITDLTQYWTLIP